ncbi:MAG: hypothetical protein KKB51_00420 [Candidatus Riflebacteria bacterium]|nr:hypothetical protein [Candidatus Riflebacteria bacterium]
MQTRFTVAIILLFFTSVNCLAIMAQNRTELINQYNARFTSGDYVQARKTLDILLASEPDNFDFQREHIKVLGALNEKEAFFNEMQTLRKNGSPVAIQNFYSIIDAKEVPEELKQSLKSHFEQANDSFILKKWEKSVRDQPLIKIGTSATVSTPIQQETSQSQATEAQQAPNQSNMTEEEKLEYDIEQKQLEQRRIEDAKQIAPEDDPGFTRH